MEGTCCPFIGPHVSRAATPPATGGKKWQLSLSPSPVQLVRSGKVSQKGPKKSLVLRYCDFFCGDVLCCVVVSHVCCDVCLCERIWNTGLGVFFRTRPHKPHTWIPHTHTHHKKTQELLCVCVFCHRFLGRGGFSHYHTHHYVYRPHRVFIPPVL